MARPTRSVARKMLGDVPQDKRFLCHDGQSFTNLRELEAGLGAMTDETFRYHVNEIKNDFSTWIRDVIGDEKLAEDLRASTTRDLAVQKVADRITFLQRTAAGR